MKVVGISTPKTIYTPGDAISLSVTVRWGFADTEGVVVVLRRGEGESYWQQVGSFDVGSPGLGIPNALKTGKNETIQVMICAPDVTGYYQIGAREQSESNVPSSGSAQIQVVPSTPGAETGNGVIHVMLNRAPPDNLMLFVDNIPVIGVPATGVYVTLPSGVYTIRAEGTGVATSSDTQIVLVSGQSMELILSLVDKFIFGVGRGPWLLELSR